MKQVITITPGGGMSGLQRKPGQGLDLTKFGKATVVRASEIVWDEDPQAWTVKLLNTGTVLDGVVLTYRMWDVAVEADYPAGSHPDAGVKDQQMRFDDYDQAVKAEIEYLDALRLKGLLS